MAPLDRVSRRHGPPLRHLARQPFSRPPARRGRRGKASARPKDAVFLEKCFSRTLDDVLALRAPGGPRDRPPAPGPHRLRPPLRPQGRGPVQSPAGPVPGQDQEAARRATTAAPGRAGEAGRGGLDPGPALRPGRGDRPPQEPSRDVRGVPRAQGRRAGRADSSISWPRSSTARPTPLASKSQDLAHHPGSLAIKNELESIRQQVQNIE